MIWRAIPVFPGYEASDSGLIRRASTGRVLIQRKTDKGHFRVKLTFAGFRADQYVQRLVCLAFHGIPADPSFQACHDDGNPAHNRPGNLYWGTSKQNAADRRRHGRDRIGPGSLNPAAKLDEPAVREIRRRLASGDNPQAIAPAYQVTPATIARIRNRKTWSHLSP